MDILNQLRVKAGLPVTGQTDASANVGQNLSRRVNYMTCGNIVELGTEIISAVMTKADGVSNSVGGQRMFKRDVAAVIANKISRRLEAVRANNGEKA